MNPSNVEVWISIGIWLFIMIAAIVIELSTTQLVSVWFAAGAMISLILAAFQINIGIQVIVFVLVSVILFVLTRPIAKKLRKNNEQIESVAAESLVGEEVLVTKQIPIGGFGEIKARYDTYTASSKENIEIQVNEKVKIVEVVGNKVVVEKK